jgi:hypothetical protein
MHKGVAREHDDGSRHQEMGPKLNAGLVMETIQDTTTASEASRSFNPAPSDIEEWFDDAKKNLPAAAPGAEDEDPAPNLRNVKLAARQSLLLTAVFHLL